MTEALRIGIVGTGNVAHQHMSGYQSTLGESAVVAAACDPRADVLADFADRYSIPARFTSADDMICSGVVDVIVLLTPPAIRDEVIYPALEKNIKLLIEKPFATSGAKAVEYVLAAESANVALAVSQNFRWFPEYQWLKQRLSEPDVGALDYLEARSFQNRPQPTGQWRADETKLEMAIFSVHLIDRLQWLAPGAPVAVSALTRRDGGSGLPGEQFTTLMVRFDDDVVATETSSWMSKTLPLNELRVDSHNGSVVVARRNPMTGDATATADYGEGIEQIVFAEEAAALHGPRTYGLSMRAFVDSIVAGVTPPHSGRNNLRTMGIMEAAYLSAARGGEAVTVAEALGGYDGLA